MIELLEVHQLAGWGAAVIVWIVGLVLGVVGLVREPRPRTVLGPIVALLGAPAAVGAAYWSLHDHFRTFGLEQMAISTLGALGWAALVVAAIVAVLEAAIATSPRSSAAVVPSDPSR